MKILSDLIWTERGHKVGDHHNLMGRWGEDCKPYVVTPDVSMLTVRDLETRVFKLSEVFNLKQEVKIQTNNSKWSIFYAFCMDCL